MAFPIPVPGLVIRYSDLWAREHRASQGEGVTDRPCAIVLTSTLHTGQHIVVVPPIAR